MHSLKFFSFASILCSKQTIISFEWEILFCLCFPFFRGKKLIDLPYTVKGMDVSFSGILSYIEVRICCCTNVEQSLIYIIGEWWQHSELVVNMKVKLNF